MANRSCILVVTEEHRATVNGVLNAMGLGPDNLARGAAATAEGPATHWFAHSYVNEALSETLLDYAEGGLPAIDFPWGMYDSPTAAAVLAAVPGFSISVSAGEAVPVDHLDGILAGMGLTPVTV